MASGAVLHDIQMLGNALISGTLKDMKIAEGVPTNPMPGVLYTINGVPHYRNTSNVEMPFDSGILSIDTAPNGGPLSVSMSGRTAVLSIREASSTESGVLTAAQYALLEGSTSANTGSTLVRRSDNGVVQVTALTAYTVTGLSDPTGQDDAANKNYVDNLVAQALAEALTNRQYNDGVDVAIYENFDLAAAAPANIQGVTVAAGTSILLSNQNDSSENGVYVLQAGNWVRRGDASSDTFAPGDAYPIVNGDQKGRIVVNVSPVGTILDTDPVSFLTIDDSVVAGNGLTKSGSTINVGGTAGRIITTADAVDIAPDYEGQTSITKVGEISTGTWAGDIIEVNHGGTGSTTEEEARVRLGVVQEFQARIGDGVKLFFDLSGNWNNPQPIVKVYYNDIEASAKVETLGFQDIRVYCQKGDGVPVEPGSVYVTIHAKSLTNGYGSDEVTGDVYVEV